MGHFYSIDQKGDLLLTLHVQPRSSVDSIGGFHGDSLKIRITAPPVEGKANAHLLRFLAKELSLRPRQITCESGEVSRHKRVRISGLTPASRSALLDLLATLSQKNRIS